MKCLQPDSFYNYYYFMNNQTSLEKMKEQKDK